MATGGNPSQLTRQLQTSLFSAEILSRLTQACKESAVASTQLRSMLRISELYLRSESISLIVRIAHFLLFRLGSFPPRLTWI